MSAVPQTPDLPPAPPLSRGEFHAQKVYRAMQDANIEEGEPLSAVLEAVAEVPIVCEELLRVAMQDARTLFELAEVKSETKVTGRITQGITAALRQQAIKTFRRDLIIAGAISAGALVVAALVGFWLGHYAYPPLHPWGADNCRIAPQKAGGVAYSCIFWVQPPPI